ncbi:phosphoribosylamine--glycine ligase [Methanocella conradii HZ254]|uniref:Phosphoribosylamine--glycine ligase n=1 Tax=Methanocella conradii (strain DSM 24694 / JCM 17849 / CGMCC 1.5162 / HZ254) TaxID=1041930 RepID=H8IAB1_METCZ|nr:phosphoribosylamine--glycine ligase [Methanocella conradii]AFC99585.1 phosphoribosylamine--glycine ligase [Methanocella conradii HZ254]MDI6897432.1 phosphoribosylamine--glycine ligase [Methanocella conradii]
MKVLVVGSGGRENSIVEALARSAYKPKIYAAMGNLNPGIRRRSVDYFLTKETDVQAIAQYAEDRGVDFVVVGPEAPLAAGLVDELYDRGIPAASPVKEAALLESDKAWTRAFMARNGIRGVPRFKVYDNLDDAFRYLKEYPDSVIKPAGLTGGKGVKVMGEHLKTLEEGKAYLEEALRAGRVVIEDRLEGEEVTIQAFVDGKNVAPMPAVQDHKRAYEDDKGPNTGGMGSYTDHTQLLPFMELDDYKEGVEIMKATVEALKKELGIAYKGTLYGQFMLTADGMKVIEYNARFGDPEAMNVLTLLKTDFVDVCQAIIDGSLDKMDVEFEKSATVCKYVVPKGYPEAPLRDSPLTVTEKPEYKVYYASVNERDGKIYTTSSRSLAIVGVADTIAEAEILAEMGLSNVHGEFHCRHDIGKETLIRKRIEHMDAIRGRRRP